MKCKSKECDTALEDQVFHKNTAKKGGFSTICKSCSKKSSRDYYLRNIEEHKERVKVHNRTRREVARETLFQYLSDKSCVECGESDIRTLDFDHIKERGEKTKDISKMIATGSSWNKILEEISKCEVVCSNCHRKRTMSRGNQHRHLFYLKQLEVKSL